MQATSKKSVFTRLFLFSKMVDDKIVSIQQNSNDMYREICVKKMYVDDCMMSSPMVLTRLVNICSELAQINKDN